VYLMAVLGAMWLRPALSHAADYTGQWRGTITESTNDCKKLGKGKPGEYTLTFVHKGDEFVGMENTIKRPYQGVVNPSRPQFVHLVGSYATDGGYVMETVDLEFQKETNGIGKSTWRWSNDFFSCGGRFTFTLEKIQPR
jgi:hypothetical protein